MKNIDEFIAELKEHESNLIDASQRMLEDGWQELFKELTPEREAEMTAERVKDSERYKEQAYETHQLYAWLEELKDRRSRDEECCINPDSEESSAAELTDDQINTCHRIQMSICKVILDMSEDLVWAAIEKAMEGNS